MRTYKFKGKKYVETGEVRYPKEGEVVLGILDEPTDTIEYFTNPRPILRTMEDFPDSVTLDGKTYVKLKSLSPESVYGEGISLSCQEWKDEFDKYLKVVVSLNGFYREPKLEWLLGMQGRYPKWLPWLISHGYIACEEKKEKKVVVIEGVSWRFGMGQEVVPYHLGISTFSWRDAMHKPPMTMTLTWEE
jgi:hypothetical protein